jgi:hypothetical protein
MITIYFGNNESIRFSYSTIEKSELLQNLYEEETGEAFKHNHTYNCEVTLDNLSDEITTIFKQYHVARWLFDCKFNDGVYPTSPRFLNKVAVDIYIMCYTACKYLLMDDDVLQKLYKVIIYNMLRQNMPTLDKIKEITRINALLLT